MNNNNRFFQIIKLVAATLALLFLIGGVANLVSKQPALVALAEPTATSTETPSATPPATASPTLYASLLGSSTATPTPSVTLTATATATSTPAPTSTATATPVPPSATPTGTATPEPSATPTEELTDTATPIATAIPTEAAAIITATLTLTLTFTATPSGPPTLVPTPTSTPTPVPRTERADNAPDYSLAEPHFWFTRPYSDTYATWGSQFYPYGTNNDGNYLWHHGIDIQNPDGIPILAVGDGQVIFAGADERQAVGPQPNFYGQAVIIRHNQTIANTEKRPVYTLYGHVSQVLVQEGESVVTGQPIALTGQEGVALGPHLHLEVRLDQNTYLQTQNPDLWVRPDPGYGVIAGRIVDTNGFYVPQQLITLHRAETPNKFWRQTRTYPDNRYTFDPQLGETFTFADVPTGAYIVQTIFDGRNYSLPVTVTNQVLSFILIEGQPPPPTVTPTPDTLVTATPVTP